MRDLMAMIPGGGVAPLVFIGCLIGLLSLLKAASAPPAPVAKPSLTKREAAMLRALEQVLPMYRIRGGSWIGDRPKSAQHVDQTTSRRSVVDHPLLVE